MTTLIIGSICLFTVFLRSPFEDIPPDEDFGLYVYYPFFKKRGIRLVKDLWADFPLTLSYVYKIIGRSKITVKKVRQASTVLNVVLALMLYTMVSREFGIIAGICAASVFSFYFTDPHLGTYFANQEPYMLFFTLSGVMLLEFCTSSKGSSHHITPVAGILFGLAAAFKPVTVVHTCLFLGYLYLGKNVPGVELAFFLILFVLPLGLLALFEQNKFKDKKKFWEQVNRRYELILSYRKSLKKLPKQIKENLLPLLRGGVFLFSFSLAALLLMYPQIPEIWVVWLVSETIVLVCQRVFWDYHFIPFYPLLSALSAVMLVYSKDSHLEVLFACGVLFFLKDLTKRVEFLFKSKAEQISEMKKQEQLIYAPEISKVIKNHTSDKERIFVWGHMVQVYFLSERAASDSFIFYITKPYTKAHIEYIKQLLENFLKHPPAFIVLSRPDFNIRYIERLTGLKFRFYRNFGENIALYKLSSVINKKPRIKKLDLLDIKTATLDPGVFYASALRNIENKRSDAWKDIISLLRCKPLDVGGLFLLGAWFEAEGEKDKAIRVYSKLIKVKRNDKNANIKLGELYYERFARLNNTADLSKAAKYLSRGLGDGLLKNYNLLCNTGEAFYKLKKYKEAEKYFQKAASFSRGRLRCYYFLGNSWRNIKNTDRTLEWFFKGLKEPVLPGENNYRTAMAYRSARILFSKGSITKAEEMVKECLRLCPEHKKAGELLLRIRSK